MESSRVISSETQAKLDNSKHVIRYQGISLSYLLEFWQRILSKSIAPDVELVVAKEKLADDVDKGQTMQIKSREPGQGGQTLKMHVPYRKNGELQQCSDDQITPKPREEWTIGDVCDFVVMDMVKEKKCFFTELDIVDPDKAVGHAFEGAFVSQARLCRFRALLAALEAHYTNISAGQGIPERTFVWLDVFCANQPLVTDDSDEKLKKERCALLTEGLHTAIENFDERLFFFDSWVNPTPLGRAWCIWEIYGAVLSKKPLQLIFVPGETERFLEALIKDPENITKAISEMRPQAAKCFSEEDRKMIEEQVIRTVGWVEVKRTVVKRIMDWLIQTTEKAVQSRTTEDSQENADLLKHAGVLMKNAGSFILALDFYKRAYEMTKTIHRTEKHPTLANILNNMAIAYREKADYPNAVEHYQGALDIDRAAHDSEKNPSVAYTLNNMAILYEELGRYPKALEYSLCALKTLEAANGSTNHPGVGSVLNEIARLYQAQAKYAEALDYYRRALDIKKAAYPAEDHPKIAYTLDGIAGVYQVLCKYKESLHNYERALNILIGFNGTEDHRNVGVIRYNMTRVYQAHGNYAKELVELRRALNILRASYSDDKHAEVAAVLHAISNAERCQGSWEQSLKSAQDSMKILDELDRGESHPDTAACLNNIAIFYQYQKDWDKSLEHFEKALKMLNDVFPDSLKHPSFAAVFNNKAIVLSNMAAVHPEKTYRQDALKLYEESLKIKKVAFAGLQNHPKIAASLNNIGKLYHSERDFVQALGFYKQSLSMFETIFDSKLHPHIAVVVSNMAELRRAEGKEEVAKELSQRSENILQTMYGENRPHMSPWIFDTIEIFL